MLVVLHTVLLASETKQHCGHCLRYSTNTCCQTDKTGEYSICRPESAHAFVLTVNLVYNKLNFLLIFEPTLMVFCLRIWKVGYPQPSSASLSWQLQRWTFSRGFPPACWLTICDHHHSLPTVCLAIHDQSDTLPEPVSTVFRNFCRWWNSAGKTTILGCLFKSCQSALQPSAYCFWMELS